MTQFSVFVSKADFRFNCAHFIAYKGFRERLHGHNYRLSVKLIGTDSIGHDGYVIDFGDIKKATRKLCKEMNEYFLCPIKSDALAITEVDQQICIVCEDGSQFSFPKKDCKLLPIMHSSAEELSHYFWCRIIRFAHNQFIT
jgi:6-pyruvoyltetrahydropterin/6-carboxytetrahydropterin synthase